MGVSLNGGTPKAPQNDQFLVGKPMVVGYHHFRKPPNLCIYIYLIHIYTVFAHLHLHEHNVYIYYIVYIEKHMH